jgi:FtsZ-interacting cell division protein ZipA
MIRDALQPLPVFQKTVRWLGQDASGASYAVTKEHEQTRFNRIISTLQLADRSGPANGEDLRNFHAKVEDLATRISAEVEWREHGDPLQYARDLDQFCIDVDVMISLQLNAGAGASFAGTKLRGLAEAGGLVLKDDGQFHCLNDAGESLFVLACLERRALTPDVLRTVLLRGVVLMMDVPRVANGVEVFNQMVLLGRKLEAALSIKLMDENQHLLGDADIEKIRQQLKVIYSKMHARGVSPGNTTALRLFS